MTPASPALVAVVGPVEPALLTAWTAHYRRLGVERFHLAFHFPQHVPDAGRRQLPATARELGLPTGQISTGPWHEHTNTELRDALREQAAPAGTCSPTPTSSTPTRPRSPRSPRRPRRTAERWWAG